MKAPKYDHQEAYCLMRYAVDGSSVAETLWNSRDGVTPFGISHPETGERMLHIDWNADTCVPDFIPPIGMRIFVDLSPQRALRLAREQLEAYPPAAGEFLSVERMADSMLAYGGGGAPDVVVVDAKLQRRLIAKRYRPLDIRIPFVPFEQCRNCMRPAFPTTGFCSRFCREVVDASMRNMRSVDSVSSPADMFDDTERATFQAHFDSIRILRLFQGYGKRYG